MCKDPTELSQVFLELQRCLAMLGLECEASKCKLLPIGAPSHHNLERCLNGITPEIVDTLRFIGLKIK